MNFDFEGNPDYGSLTVHLQPGDTFLAEAGAMAYMSSGMEVKTKLMGGIAQALIRKVTGGESLFAGEYSHPSGGTISFSPSVPGSVVHRKLDSDSILLTSGSFLACTPGVNLKMKFGGLKALFSGEGAFQIECSGTGDLFFNSYGAIVEKEINGSYTVDTGHVVAWDPSLEYSIGGMGSMKSTLLSGEGLVMKFTGHGKIYLQTRTLSGLAGWLNPYLRG
ncbi:MULTISPECIES: TIGR00266 family protein [Thalassoglobus]|uniref:TIGR00266 family protein n=1 Tax=Thalassoglobus polymorphus TaxID=2527994 RepID=A0A517QU07_9PLAN|nr:TIGR00266 family protein [Thalassoglobus polymorphus]QDT35116.1 hypothetical protein Mal48_43910 [Thalassoglobus polymorphus]